MDPLTGPYGLHFETKPPALSPSIRHLLRLYLITYYWYYDTPPGGLYYALTVDRTARVDNGVPGSTSVNIWIFI